MENHSKSFLFYLVLLFVSCSISPAMPSSRGASSYGGGEATKPRTYVIRMRLPENTTFASNQALESWYRSLLPPTTANSSAARFVYAYSAAITGFAARLTKEELNYVSKKEGFLKSYPDIQLRLLTTHTHELLGLQADHGLWSKSNMGKGVVIGVLDTGFSPGHPSFRDDGMGPPPSKWKGQCASNRSGCNKKVIGARTFISAGGGSVADRSAPLDDVGHGTHTSSTAAGSFVKKANVLGNGNGTAAGMAPRAYLSIYKVCGIEGCSSSDVLAGMDSAIKDGVDVLSLSLGGGRRALYDDVIAIGAYSAIEKGIFVSCAGGNSGPSPGSLSNEAPWILTVGATTIDRNIRATVKLGNGLEFDGETAFQPANFSSTMLPLTMPRRFAGAPNCLVGMAPAVKGKMVVCRRGFGSRIQLGETVKTSGGAAMLLINGDIDGYTTFAEAHHLPVSHLNYVNGSSIEKYVSTSKEPVASITFKGTVLGISPAPTISFFSSRGPSSISPGILKPDVVGPGVNILAAWPTSVGPPSENCNANMTFNMISGTSMSTPHLSGIAALIKSAHPDWSPAVIKSAIMTTSDIMDNEGKPISDEQHQPATFFAMGAGHVNPSKAVNPGLVYDLEVDDYIGYLCGLGYFDDQVEVITHHKVTCAKVKKIKDVELNYPAIVVRAPAGLDKITVVNRTVRYVSEGRSAYKIKVDTLNGVQVNVSPETMEFSGENEAKTYTVSFNWSSNVSTHAEGNLWWVSDKHSVRIPIVVMM